MDISAIGTTYATSASYTPTTSGKARTTGNAANLADSLQRASQQYDFTSIRPIDVPRIAEDLKNSGKLTDFEAGYWIITADNTTLNKMLRGTYDHKLELQPVNYIAVFDAGIKFAAAHPVTDEAHSTVKWMTDLRDKLAYLQSNRTVSERT